MSIQLRVKHIFLFTYLFHKVSFDVTTLSCQCQKSFGEGEGQRRNRMCLSAQSKTLASHNQEGGEKGNGNKEDTLRKKKNLPTSTFCHAFYFFVHFSSPWRVFPSLQQNNIKGFTSMTAS